ncbi:MAG: hypothetical protein AAFN92_13295, partial [Bacteroidota bacterium]
MYPTRKLFGLVLGPLLFLLTLLLVESEGLSPAGRGVLATTLWVATWWILEVIPIAATAMLPMVLFPLTGGDPERGGQHTPSGGTESLAFHQ